MFWFDLALNARAEILQIFQLLFWRIHSDLIWSLAFTKIGQWHLRKFNKNCLHLGFFQKTGNTSTICTLIMPPRTTIRCGENWFSHLAQVCLKSLYIVLGCDLSLFKLWKIDNFQDSNFRFHIKSCWPLINNDPFTVILTYQNSKSLLTKNGHDKVF